jgi:Tol biopolymer transport system component/predicted Ser/Thr protein kinase
MADGNADQIGPYQVLREIGRGGMGVVYLARDERLDRDVAIKVLPDELAGDAERLARFEREAKSLAQLNHPNIAGIYGIEEQNGQKYLILEYVEGETLGDRLDRGALPIDEAIEIAVEIASGVEAAHEAGVIHRDLKPDNIKITPEGRVKVLDFGLAKVMDDRPSSIVDMANSPTVTRGASPTMPGAILGTAGYLSPEQARGKPVDKRTDIFSFGCILYEMLTGLPPFPGETPTDSIGATLHKELDFQKLPAGTPRMVRHVLGRCLQRDVARRYRDIGDVRVVLETSFDADEHDAPTPAAGMSPKLVAGWVTLGLVVGGALAFGASRFLRSGDGDTSVPLRVERFGIPLGHLGEAAEAQPDVAIAPDGSAIAYEADGQLWVRAIDDFVPAPIDQSQGATSPFWSPDSQWIGFARGMELWKTTATGTGARKIGPIPAVLNDVSNAVWRDDGQIIFGTNIGSVYEISANGGAWNVLLSPPPGVNDFHSVGVLPPSRALLVTVHFDSEAMHHRIAIWDGESLHIFRDLGATDAHVGYAVYSKTGHILFEQFGANAGIWAVSFSPSTLEITGSEFLVAPGGGPPSVDDHGTLAYVRGGSQEALILVWVDPESGTQTPLHDQKSEWLGFPSISPDGTSVVYISQGPSDRGAWVERLDTGARRRLTVADAGYLWPSWSPDGRRIAMEAYDAARDQSRIVFYAADGSGALGEPVENAGNPDFDGSWSTMVFQRFHDGTGLDIFAVSPDGHGEPTPIITGPGDQYDPRLSPDGKWLTYTSEEADSRQPRIYLTRFPIAQGRWEVSDGFGERARWSTDGKRLYFLAEKATLYVLDVDLSDGVSFDRKRLAITSATSDLNPYRGYALEPRSGRILVAQRVTRTLENRSIAIVKNWAAEFTRP